MKILLAVDGSEYTQKMLNYLANHADLLGNNHQYTAVTVQSALPARARAVLGKEVVDQYYAEESAKVLTPVCEFLAKHHIQAQRSSLVGHAGETIAKLAEDEKFDLVVMGTHGHGSLGKLVMGSVSTTVLAHCNVPVLLVR